jgi:hypothetical protein
VQTNLLPCFLGRCPISQLFPLNSPWACQTNAHKMMLGKTAYQARQTQKFVFHTNRQTLENGLADPNLWSPLPLETCFAPYDGTHTNCCDAPPTTAKFLNFCLQSCGYGERRRQPTLGRPRRAVQGSTALHGLQRPVFSPTWNAHHAL